MVYQIRVSKQIKITEGISKMVMMEFTSAGIWILYNIYADPLGSKVMIIRL